jgi:hypothetical protein
MIVEAPLELTTLLRCQPFIDEVISWTDGTSKGFTAWDQQIEVMELPYAHRTTLETIPCRVPYLVVDELRESQSAKEISRSRRCNVGLVWSASNWNPLRSIPLSELDPILKIGGIQFFSFQHGERRGDLDLKTPGLEIHDLAAFTPDIADTAAALTQMDLLITVDTMVAHLAGALGIPVWVLLSTPADWRWMIARRDCPWYPTMRLFRQTSPGDWRLPVAETVRELRYLLRQVPQVSPAPA